MPANSVENMPTSLSSHIIAIDNCRKTFDELKVNGHRKDQRAEGCTIYSNAENLENCNGDSNILPSSHTLSYSLKQPKVAPGIINAQAQRLPKEKPINQHTAYSHPSVHAQIEANETDVQAISELTHALEKKSVLVLEWGKLNNDVSENEKDDESDLKNSDALKKQYAAVLKQLQEANEQVSKALCHLRQRNSYHGNLSLPWTRPTTNIGDSGAILSSFNCFDDSEESRKHVNDIIESSRFWACTMVNSAIQAYASTKGGENNFEKIEEAIDHVNDQLSKNYPYILAEGSFVAADAGNLTSHELFNPKSSSLQEPSSQKLKNPPVPSELITKCVATLLIIQNCTE